MKCFYIEAGLKKLFVCRHSTDPALDVPTQNILLDLYKQITFFDLKNISW